MSQSSVNEQYLYQPLPAGSDWIRILHLWPSSDDKKLQGQLVAMRLSDDEAYETLSYTWRGPGAAGAIELDGRTLPLRANCKTALVNLRKMQRMRKIWVDAVCINQNDPVEKQAQVRMMGEIYARATRTVVFLGRPDGTVQLLSRKALLSNIGAGVSKEHRAELEEARTRLLDRPWYNRKWIVQEVLLSRALLVRAGAHDFEWTELEEIDSNHTLDIFNIATKYLHPSCKSAISIDGRGDKSPATKAFDEMHQRGEVTMTSRQRSEKTKNHSSVSGIGFLRPSQWFDLLCLTSEFQCTEPRDHIYALMSLFDQPPEFEPDYGCSDEEVYFRLTKELLRIGETRMLWLDDRDSWRVHWSDVLGGTSGTSTLAASVRHKGEINKKDRGPADIGRPYNEILHEKKECTNIILDKSELLWTATGIHVGTIRIASPREFSEHPAELNSSTASADSAAKSQWRSILESVLTTSSTAESTDGSKQAVYHNLTASLDAEHFEGGVRPLSYIHERNRHALPWFRNWTKDVFSHSADGKQIGLPESDSLVAIKSRTRQHHGHLSFCKGMRMFACFNGLLGLAEPPVEEGDHIYFLPGYTCPFLVLRPSDEQLKFVTLAWVGPLKLFPSIAGKNLRRFTKDKWETVEII